MTTSSPTAPSWLLNRREAGRPVEWVASTDALAAYDDTEVSMVIVADGTNFAVYIDTSLTSPATTSALPSVLVGGDGRTWRRQVAS